MSAADDLRAAAVRAFEEGRLRDAIKIYREVETLETDPESARREAQLHNRLGDASGELEALNRAARGYMKLGDILKAAVTSKLILAINPEHEETRDRIPELVAMRDADLMQAPRTVPPPPPTPEVAEQIADAIHTFYFRDLLPVTASMAPPPMGPPLNSGVHRIALRGDVTDDDFEIVVEEPVEAGPDEGPIAIDIVGNVVPTVRRSIPPEKAGIASDALRSTLFAGLSSPTFAALLTQARLLDLADKAEVFHQGDVGEELYVVVSGTVGVIDEGPPRRGITKLGEKSVFGEIAVLTDQPRTATVIALGPVQLIAIDRGVVGRLSAQDPRFLDGLLRFLRDRLVERLLSSNPLFAPLSDRDRAALKPRFQLLEVDAGAVLIEQDKVVPGLLLLLAGGADVVRLDEDGGRVLGRLKPGDVAGEISLLTKSPAIASVRANTRSLAVSLPAAVFHTIVNARPDAMSFIQRVADQRLAQSKAILSGDAPHVEGHVIESP